MPRRIDDSHFSFCNIRDGKEQRGVIEMIRQIPERRIASRTIADGVGLGVVSFEPRSDNATEIILTLRSVFDPSISGQSAEAGPAAGDASSTPTCSMPVGYAEGRNIVFPKSAVRGRSLFTEKKETMKAIRIHRRWHDPREARTPRSEFRDQPPSSRWRGTTASHKRSPLYLREFAENSRIFAAFAPGANRPPQFFFPGKSAFRNLAGIRYANAAVNERNLNP
jgi:hypothetical protein